jgi:hypothetical protein
MIQKVPRISQKVEHIIKWNLNPGLTVSINPDSRSYPLPEVSPPAVDGTLTVDAKNPRYFANKSGKVVYLTGSHGWQNFIDSGASDPPPKFDYDAYLNFLKANNHNFIRLYNWEQARWSLDSPNNDFRFSPQPYQRVSGELAADGLPKFDLTQFNRPYFDRLRERVIEAGKRGIYTSVMLFDGWSIVADKGIPGRKNPWQGHPFNRANNMNGIDGDLNKNGSGEEVHELVIPAITAIQEAYVRKVVDTISDLDNVLYEISNESQTESVQWQYHMINVIKSYESSKPKQHPIGMTSTYPNGNNLDLLNSPADWVSLTGDINRPPVAEGRKVILADSDHLCGVCEDRRWIWKSFTRGENPIFMDVYDGAFDLIVEKVPPNPLNYPPLVNLRRNLGYALTYANRMNLAAMVPYPDLASSEYCLANPASSNAEYLIYVPSDNKVTVDLGKTQGQIAAEWFNPSTGLVTTKFLTTGGGRRTFIVPFKNDAVLYLRSN